MTPSCLVFLTTSIAQILRRGNRFIQQSPPTPLALDEEFDEQVTKIRGHVSDVSKVLVFDFLEELQIGAGVHGRQELPVLRRVLRFQGAEDAEHR